MARPHPPHPNEPPARRATRAKPARRQPQPKAAPPDEPLSVSRPTLPFYARTAQSRALRAGLVRVVDSIGLPAICPRPACRRAHACQDNDMRDRPFCAFHYRDLVRFVLQVVRARSGLEPDLEAEPVREMPPPWRGRTLFQRFALTPDDLAEMARAADAGERWQLERDPEVQTLLKALRAERAAEVAAGRGIGA